ncbi:MAG: hypothetical protein ACYC9O_19540 [Candidatus Latescibacterota bacterium]
MSRSVSVASRFLRSDWRPFSGKYNIRPEKKGAGLGTTMHTW